VNKLGVLLIWLIFVLVLFSTGLLLLFRSLLAATSQNTLLYVTIASFLGGLLPGYLARRLVQDRWVRILVLLVSYGLMATYLRWMILNTSLYVVVSEGILFRSWQPFVWAGAAVVSSFATALLFTRRQPKPPEGFLPSDKEALKFIQDHDLFATEEEIQRLAKAGKPYICPYDREPHTGLEVNNPDWRKRWVRCPKIDIHIYHAHDFKRAGWRCPKDGTLLYKPKY